jgi:hypothetical protein
MLILMVCKLLELPSDSMRFHAKEKKNRLIFRLFPVLKPKAIRMVFAWILHMLF